MKRNFLIKTWKALVWFDQTVLFCRWRQFCFWLIYGNFWSQARQYVDSCCVSCGKPYDRFAIDVILPDHQWKSLAGGEESLLCPPCIIQKIAERPDVVAIELTWRQ